VIWCLQELQKRLVDPRFHKLSWSQPFTLSSFTNMAQDSLQVCPLAHFPPPSQPLWIGASNCLVSQICYLHMPSVWGVRSHLLLNSSRHKIPNLFSRRDTQGYKILPTNMSVGNLNAFILQLVIYFHIFICQNSQN
jgi:hypothetical protein